VPISSVTSLQLFQERRNTSNDQVGQKCTMLVLADSRGSMQFFHALVPSPDTSLACVTVTMHC
jgi:hypothetical protein